MTDEKQRIPYDEMRRTFRQILAARGLAEERAEQCARIFADSSLDGVYSHGVNRFPFFVEFIDRGFVHVSAEPECIDRAGAVERWHGHSGPGPLNAWRCTERAVALARQHGVGCVALSHTNHWMRAGTYGWQAARAGCVFICWSNTKPNMAPWPATDHRIGNNPLVFAVPKGDGAVVLDMAMSQFSYGKLHGNARNDQPLPVPGGYDKDGKLTDNARAILESGQVLPIGYWKGTGLTLVLDLIAALLAAGLSTGDIGEQEEEYNVSQMFLAIDVAKLTPLDAVLQRADEIIVDYKRADQDVVYPGERALQHRRENLELGIPVETAIWRRITNLVES